MSKVLGPIHYWMYDKIVLNEELLAAIAKKAVDEGWTDEKALEDEEIGEQLPPLDELVDTSNIHGSIQGLIDRSESRFAAFVSSVLADDPERLPSLLEAAKDFGRAHAPKESVDAQALYRYLNDNLLNGMPCDRVNTVTDISSDGVFWEQEIDLHEQYWTEEGRDVSNYYALRNAMTEGMLEGTGYVLKTPDKDHYSIEKEGAALANL